MRRIHKITAVGGASLLATLVLAPAALAAGAARAGSRVVAGPGVAASLPHTNIQGKPAHWAPSKLKAKARYTSGSCTVSNGSFTYTNEESKTETIKFTGTDHLQPDTVSVPAHDEFVQCIGSGYHGTETGKLSDGKKLTVKF